MKRLLALFVVTILTCGAAQAADEYVGTWGSGSKELLTITKDKAGFKAEFFRKNVKSEYEKVLFPASLVDGVFVISGDVGQVSVQYDATKELLMLGGVKPFKKLSTEQAAAQLEKLKAKLPVK